MKKLLCLLLALICMISAGCYGKSDDSDPNRDTETDTETGTETESDAETHGVTCGGNPPDCEDFWGIPSMLNFLSAIAVSDAQIVTEKEIMMDHPAYLQLIAQIQSEKQVYLPYHCGEWIEMRDDITLMEWDTYQQPWFWFSPVEGCGILRMMYMPEGFEESDILERFTILYQKDRVLADRTVTAYVSLFNEGPRVRESFIYGDLLIDVIGEEDTITDEWYRGLSFQKTALPTEVEMIDLGRYKVLYKGMLFSRFHKGGFVTSGWEAEATADTPKIYQFCVPDELAPDPAQSLYVWVSKNPNGKEIVERFEWIDRMEFDYPDLENEPWLLCSCHGEEILSEWERRTQETLEPIED